MDESSLVFNIPRSGQVEGIRPLGRLALCDHRQTVRKQIEQQLLKASAANAIASAADRFEFPIRLDGIDVYVVASTVGGTSSGTVADVGLMVRSIAASMSILTWRFTASFCMAPAQSEPPQMSRKRIRSQLLKN
ncbi:MAG TPA: hypothetical protein EYG03_19225 [Planctomycetes bacterium]|nr:hypothetical protein [Fuerstiella sp.]HIK94083.1 hypothetical protein [Planctomycetota bacterium]